MSDLKEVLRAVKEERYATAEVMLEQLSKKKVVSIKEILDLAEEHGDWDDFGRWTFRDDDRLLAFAWAIEAKLKERT
jgi:hypothetical protein